ncbi:hypothetical protein ACIPQB_14830 [Caulobacter sp. LARHSG274]
MALFATAMTFVPSSCWLQIGGDGFVLGAVGEPRLSFGASGEIFRSSDGLNVSLGKSTMLLKFERSISSDDGYVGMVVRRDDEALIAIDALGAFGGHIVTLLPEIAKTQTDWSLKLYLDRESRDLPNDAELNIVAGQILIPRREFSF